MGRKLKAAVTAAVSLIGMCRCLRCLHEWWPRSPERPRICPKCKSAYWDVPRKDEQAAKQAAK